MIGDKWMNIRADYNKGMNDTEIAKKYNVDERTAKKYVKSTSKPHCPENTGRVSKIDELLTDVPYNTGVFWKFLTTSLQQRPVPKDHRRLRLQFSALYRQRADYRFSYPAFCS